MADAIEYCNETIKMVDFQRSEATVRFIRAFERLFDIFNSRNPRAQNFKAPLKLSNLLKWQSFVDESLMSKIYV